MKMLLNGCSRSEFAVTPKNWKSARASIKRPWRIHYRFYDPEFRDVPKYKKGKQVNIVRMNKYKSLEERQDAVRELMDIEEDLIDNQAYNQITGKFMKAQEEISVEQDPLEPGKLPDSVESSTGWLLALRIAASKIDMEVPTRDDTNSTLRYLEQSAELLGMHKAPVCEVSRKDIRAILDNCKNLTVTKLVNKREEVKGKLRIVRHMVDGKMVPVKEEKKTPKIWTANQFNHYRAILSMLYTELEEQEAVEYNPVEKISKKENEKDTRDVLTHEQRVQINYHLQAKVPTFHRYVHIFFHSGSRRTELLRVKGAHVDLARQRFKVLVKKGRKGSRNKWVWKTIKDVALPYWIDAMRNCQVEDYVFSVGLQPGAVKIGPKQISERWRRHVKEDLGIDVDFYSLKHLHTTEIADIIDEQEERAKEAAEHNSHTTPAMVVEIYDVRAEERKHNRVKAAKNAFA